MSSTASPVAQRVLYEAGRPGDPLPFGSADRWYVVVALDDIACAYPTFPSPGAVESSELTAALLDGYAELPRRRAQLGRALLKRLGAPAQEREQPTCTVVVCTHRRRQQLARLLEALGRLDPPADEIIVVDSHPGEDDCRAEVLAAGARYLRVDRPGLNVARAIGVEAANGVLVAYTDDDCVPPPSWLRSSRKLFDDPTVGAVCGPAFALSLATEPQRLRERHASFVHELRRRREDWTTLRPVNAGASGAGANMILRTSLIEELDDPFPQELDAGTPTRGGGDLYVLYRILASGRRVAYDPGCWVLHDHAPTEHDLEATVSGYGIAFAAFLTKVLVEERELRAPANWTWLVGEYLSFTAGLDIRRGPLDVRVRARYLRGGLRGPAIWWQTRPRSGRSSKTARDAPRPGLAVVPEAVPGMAVISGASAAERNRRARAASQPFVLFVEGHGGPGFAALHLETHAAADGDVLAFGVERARGCGGSLTRQLAALAIEDRAYGAARALADTVADVPWSVLSLPRHRFLELGGFDERLAGRPAALDLALRAIDAGIELARVDGAEVDVHPPETLAELAESARKAGIADGVIAARRASAPPPPLIVPPRRGRRWTAPAHGAFDRLLSARRTRLAAIGLCNLLEAGRMRDSWLRIARAIERGAHLAGRRSAGGGSPGRPLLRLELTESGPLPIPRGIAPDLDVRIRGRRAALVRPRHGQWTPRIAEQIVDALGGRRMEALARATPLRPARPAAEALAGCEVGVVAHRFRRRSPVASLRAAGARVHEIVPGRGFWRRADALIRACERDVFVLALPGVRVGPAGAEAAVVPLAGPRIGCVVGAGVPTGHVPQPVQLLDRGTTTIPIPFLGRAPQYIAVSRAVYEEVGGLDVSLRGGGHQAQILDLVQRVIGAGWIVAYAETTDLRPHSTSYRKHLNAWQRSRGRGRLLVDAWPRHGASWLVRHTVVEPALELLLVLRTSGPRLRDWAVRASGMAAGVLEGRLRAHRDGPSRRTYS